MDRSLTPYTLTAPALIPKGNFTDKNGFVRAFEKTPEPVEFSAYKFAVHTGLHIDFKKWKDSTMPDKTYTITILFKMSHTLGLRRIFSVRGKAENGLYVYNHQLVYWPHVLHQDAATPKPNAIKDNEWYQVTLMRNGTTDMLSAYVNGEFQWSVDDQVGDAILGDDIMNLFYDTEGYTSSGEIARFRIYSHTFSATELKNHDRQAESGIYHQYKYGRRIYRQLVMADFSMGNTLVSSVFSEYPLFVNNRTERTGRFPYYMNDTVDARPAVVLRMPTSGLTYPVDEHGKVRYFDGEAFTISTLFKVHNEPDKWMNILKWENEHSTINLRLKNWQLYLQATNWGHDLTATQKDLEAIRALGRLEAGARLNDIRFSSAVYAQEAKERRRKERLAREKARLARIAELTKPEPETPGAEEKHPQFPSYKDLHTAKESKSRMISGHKYNQMRQQWREMLRSMKIQDTYRSRDEGQVNAYSMIQERADVLLANALAHKAKFEPKPVKNETESNEAYIRKVREWQDRYDQEVVECWTKGGDMHPVTGHCNLRAIQEAKERLLPYKDRVELGASRDDCVKTDKYVHLVVSRRSDGQLEIYVDGQHQLTYLDKNVTSTTIKAGMIQFFTPDEVAPKNFNGTISRITIYDEHLRSTEIREMVRAPKYKPVVPINVNPVTHRLANNLPVNAPNCMTILPIWNFHSTNPDYPHGATMLWLHNACDEKFDLHGELCGDFWKCSAQPRSWVSCGTVTGAYCRTPTKTTVNKEPWYTYTSAEAHE
eukprot:TRINITY_DN607_c0_g1_i1.p1 TRINITY_DN607_c0_g1~~TRINITY_DN607_c0_g1_i1.p1  ORF type:complete len:896 (-),score=244.77 TRINITY_DN607_c0_g1_i1:146-2452(-)